MLRSYACYLKTNRIMFPQIASLQTEEIKKAARSKGNCGFMRAYARLCKAEGTGLEPATGRTSD